MRKLVHIEKIKEIIPINGADKIELVKLLDWQCIAKKGEFNIGDLAAYHEIDSLCPDKPEYEFLRNRNFKVKTIKMKGEFSQGLALPLSILPSGKYSEGQDITDICGVVHCDKESQENIESRKLKEPQSKVLKLLMKSNLFRKTYLKLFVTKKKDAWPSFLEHTDEENIQAIFSKVKIEYGDCSFYVTEKIDYQSATFFSSNETKLFLGIPFKSKTFGVCSKMIWKKTPDNSLWWKNARKFGIQDSLMSEKDCYVIQGESGDLSVQKNKYGIKESDFWVFTVKNTTKDKVLSLEEMEDFCSSHGLKTVPVLDRDFRLPKTVKELIEYSSGKSVLNNKVDREGVVIRLIRDGKKVVSFKVKNPDFLIKNKE